jgi:DNA (cytosine-5)-methyltransferase 1
VAGSTGPAELRIPGRQAVPQEPVRGYHAKWRRWSQPVRTERVEPTREGWRRRSVFRNRKHLPKRSTAIVAAARTAAAHSVRASAFNERGVVEEPLHTFRLGTPESVACEVFAHPVGGGYVSDFEFTSLAHEVPGRTCLPGSHSTVHPTLVEAVNAATGLAFEAMQGLAIDRKAEGWTEKLSVLESQRRALLLDLFAQDPCRPLHGMTVIELCCGAGGSGLGLRQAGARITVAVERDAEARRIYQENVRPERMAADVSDLDPNDLACDILFVGMPCQAFSVAGQHQGFEDQDRADTYEALLAIFRKADAKVIVIECARQFLTRNGGADATKVRRELAKGGYLVQQRVLSAECFGSPLARERAFMVATRIGIAADPIIGFLFPREQAPTAAVEDILDQGLPATIPEADITLHTPEPAKRQARRVEVGHIAGRDRQGYRVYSPRGVGATLTASGGGRARCTGAYKVPGGARGLTPREAHRGMGFPEWAAVHPVATHAYRHAGNAVAVPVAYAVAAQIGAVLRSKSGDESTALCRPRSETSKGRRVGSKSIARGVTHE